MDLLEQHKEMMNVLNKIEENTRLTKGYANMAMEALSNDESLAMIRSMINAYEQQQGTEIISTGLTTNENESNAEQEPANEPEGQPQAS